MKTSFMNEEVIIQKPNGFSTKVFAVVSTKTIIAEDVGVVIESGDLITRKLRNGEIQTYNVINSLHKTPEGRPANYQILIEMLEREHLNLYHPIS